MRWTALTVAAWLLSPAPADASVLRYENQQATTNPVLIAMRDAAVAHWDTVGVTGCVPDMHVADDLGIVNDAVMGPTAVERGWNPEDQGECLVAVQRNFAQEKIGRSERPFRGFSPRQQVYLRRGALLELCSTITHGVGHSRGLEHTPTGVMSHHMTVADIPAECRQVARRLVPRPVLRRQR